MQYKVINGFLLRQLQDEYLLIPSGVAAQHFSGLIALNETGADLFRILQSGATKEEMLLKMRSCYAVSEQELAADIEELLAQLRELGILIEEET